MESSVSSSDHHPLTDIEELTAHDVLCGRGVTTNKWAGNEQFRSLVGLNKELYVTSTKRQKMAISRSIVDAVRSMNPPGRFLEKNMDTGLWNDIGNRKAIEKTSQALRDGAATLRKQLSADLGDPEFLSAVFDMEAATRKASPVASKEKETVVKAKPNVKKGIRRTMSSPDVASSSTTMKEKSVLKRAIKRMDTSDSSSELHPPPRQSHSNPSSPREGRYAHNMYRGGPYPHQFPPLQVEFSGPRGFLDCVSDYPMCGNHYRPYDAGYENYDSHRPPWYPGAPPYPRAYPPPPHPNHRAPFSPPSYDSQYWRHPPSSPAGSVRSAGTVRSSPAALPEYDRRPIHPPYPYQHHPPPPYYPRNISHPQLFARQRLEGSVSPLSGSHPASPGDFTPPMSPHSDRIPKREETVLTARSSSPDDVADHFNRTEVMEDSFGFEVVLRERDEAAFESSPMRDDFKQPGQFYFSYTKDEKDNPAQISHEEDHTSPFRYDDDDHGSTSFMMDIADDLLLEPIAPVGPMDEMQAIRTSSPDGM